jgi:hypothetical protein
MSNSESEIKQQEMLEEEEEVESLTMDEGVAATSPSDREGDEKSLGGQQAKVVCSYGSRLGFSYFSSPCPSAQALNSDVRNETDFYFTVDDELLYLSFFQDTGPLNAACL